MLVVARLKDPIVELSSKYESFMSSLEVAIGHESSSMASAPLWKIEKRPTVEGGTLDAWADFQ